MWTGDWRDVDNQGQGGLEGARVFAAKIKTKLHKQRAYTLQEGLQDEIQVVSEGNGGSYTNPAREV